MKYRCLHKQMSTTVVDLGPTEPGQHRQLAMTARCYECGAPFEFVGVEGPGVDLTGDRRGLKVIIAEAAKLSNWSKEELPVKRSGV